MESSWVETTAAGDTTKTYELGSRKCFIDDVEVTAEEFRRQLAKISQRGNWWEEDLWASKLTS